MIDDENWFQLNIYSKYINKELNNFIEIYFLYDYMF